MDYIWCPDCNANMGFVELNQHSYWPEDGLRVVHKFGYCLKCRRPAVLEYIEVDDGQFDRTQVLPALGGSLDFPIPRRIADSYEEAVRCHATGSWHATAVMVGRALEALGKEFDPNAGTLFDGLRRMKAAGVISDEVAHWGDELRFLRNIGAHSTDHAVTAQDARDAVDFLNAIVEILYHLRPKFQAMQARRHARSGTTPS